MVDAGLLAIEFQLDITHICLGHAWKKVMQRRQSQHNCHSQLSGEEIVVLEVQNFMSL